MCGGYATDWGIPRGFNRIENHEKLIADFENYDSKSSSSRSPESDLFFR